MACSASVDASSECGSGSRGRGSCPKNLSPGQKFQHATERCNRKYRSKLFVFIILLEFHFAPLIRGSGQQRLRGNVSNNVADAVAASKKTTSTSSMEQTQQQQEKHLSGSGVHCTFLGLCVSCFSRPPHPCPFLLFPHFAFSHLPIASPLTSLALSSALCFGFVRLASLLFLGQNLQFEFRGGGATGDLDEPHKQQTTQNITHIKKKCILKKIKLVRKYPFQSTFTLRTTQDSSFYIEYKG